MQLALLFQFYIDTEKGKEEKQKNKETKWPIGPWGI